LLRTQHPNLFFTFAVAIFFNEMGASKTLVFVGTLLLLHGGDAKIIKPGSSAELQSAFDQAAPGDTIQMLPMNYVGDFVISTNGPCTLVGDGNSSIESQDIGIHMKGSNWNLKSFEIKGPQQGILIEGTKNVLEGVVLQKCGKAMVIKGEDNTIKSCVISEADIGINLDGSRNNLHYNSINIQNPAIVIPPESCCGYLEANVANGEVHLDGNGYRLENNVANHGLYVKGCDNEFTGNVANGASFPKECAVIDKGGNVYRGLGPNDSDLPNPNQPQQDQQQGFYQPPPQQNYYSQGGAASGYPTFAAQAQGQYQQQQSQYQQPQQQPQHQAPQQPSFGSATVLLDKSVKVESQFNGQETAHHLNVHVLVPTEVAHSVKC
ncbi:hypothetical protein Bhyg_17235, partial [Pseudolycoriella hygida]